MEVLRRPLFLICVGLFLIHQALQWLVKINLPFADAYLDNLLVMPIVLTLWLAEKQVLIKKAIAYQLSLAEIVAATFYILLITECIFPMLSSRFTADGWDILFTALGSLVYYYFAWRHKTPTKTKQP